MHKLTIDSKGKILLDDKELDCVTEYELKHSTGQPAELKLTLLVTVDSPGTNVSVNRTKFSDAGMELIPKCALSYSGGSESASVALKVLDFLSAETDSLSVSDVIIILDDAKKLLPQLLPFS